MNQTLSRWAGGTGLAAIARGTGPVNPLAPSVLLTGGLVSALLLAWLAGRLLGVRRRSWVSVLVCGFTGWLAGMTLTLLMAHGNARAPGGARNAIIFMTVFTMVATAGWELLVRPGRRPTSPALVTSLPHPVRAIRRSARRTRRYLQIIRIAVRHGLGPYLGFRHGTRGPDRAADPARQARLALDEAGGMFVKLGQMLSTRPDIVSPGLARELTRLQEHVAPLWSADVLDELERALAARGLEKKAVTHRIGEMRRAFPDAEVRGYENLVETMTCDPKDSHVLAAAVRSDAAVLVTFNIDDFPDTSTAAYDITVVHPDD